MEKRKMIIDLDTGVDDAQALMMALAGKDEIDILAITCVAGNTNVDQVCYNTMRILKLCGRTEIPVYKGVSRALIQDPLDGSIHHAQDGLGDVPDYCPPDMTLLRKKHAVNALVDIVNTQPGEVTLVALGPLSNLALALRIDPEFGKKLKNAVIMGGNMEGKGNITVSGEFNFQYDPESASIVLQDLKCPIQLLCWEACLHNGIDWDWYDKLDNEGSELARFHHAINEFSTKRKKEVFKAPLYFSCDPTAMVIAITPSCIIESKHVFCTVELNGKITRGQMVVDWANHFSQEPNVELITKVNNDDIKRWFVKMLK